MKKLIMAAAMTAVMAVSASAFAASYDPGAGAAMATSNEGTYKTVLITTDDVNQNIVYVNQNDSGIGAATKFLIKSNAAPGNYVLKMGGSDSQPLLTEKFTITAANVTGKTKELEDAGEVLTDDGLYSKGFKLDGSVAIQNYNSISVTYDGKTLLYPLDRLFQADNMSGNVYVGIKITGIPSDKKDGVAVSLSPTVATEKTSTGSAE
ncbi:MAG: hypothetical protein PUF72_10540 [Clostridiales bacterium]|nr:hypothetical protein [Clostridiales bacterium]